MSKQNEEMPEHLRAFAASPRGKFIEALMEGVAEGIKEAIAPLKQRIADLESRPTMKYLGTWEQQRQYNEGDFVTCEGSMFACRASTRSRPGSNSDWQLAIKRGRDGKGGRS